MSVSNVGSLNRAVQETQQWLNALAAKAPFGNAEQAYSGLRAVLHALRDRMTVEEAVHFSAQLPMLVRGFYFEGWRPALAPNSEQTPEGFFGSVEQSLRNATLTLAADEATRAVFEFLEETMDSGQLRHVKDQLPSKIKKIWPTA